MSETVDLRTLDLPIDIPRQRTQLEAIVAPCVTTKKSPFVIAFKGARRYLKPGTPENKVIAAMALQFLYNAEAAHKAGDIDRAIRAAFGFGYKHYEVAGLEVFDIHPVEAMAFYKRRERDDRPGLDRVHGPRRHEPARVGELRCPRVLAERGDRRR